MFYCQEILQRRCGSFGVVWLAAMNNRSLSKREYQKVCVHKKCEEILDYVMHRKRSNGDHLQKFSLYLSAQLMYGTVKVYFEQNKFLLTDCLEAQKRIFKVLISNSNFIPEAESLSVKKLCLTEDFSEIPRQDYENQTPLIQIGGYLEESLDLLRDAGPDNISSMTTLHTAPYHSITLQEITDGNSLLFSSSVPPDMDLAPFTAEDINTYFIEPPMLSPIHYQPEVEAETHKDKLDIPEFMAEMENTPAIEPPELPVKRPEKRPVVSRDDVTAEDEQIQQQLKRRRITSALVLPPLERSESQEHLPLVKRSHNLILDEPRSFSKEEIKQRLATHATTSKPPILPTSTVRLETLMVEPGSRGVFNSRYQRGFFRRVILASATHSIPVDTNGAQATKSAMDSTQEAMRIPNTPFTDSISLNASKELLRNADQNILGESILNMPSVNTSPAVGPVDQTSLEVSKSTRSRRTTNAEESIRQQLVEPIDDPMPPPEAPLLIEEPLGQSDHLLDPERPVNNAQFEINTPSLYIDDGINQNPSLSPSISVKDKLIRSLKKGFLTKDPLNFTDLEDLIRPGHTIRQDVAKYFYGLLTLAKRKIISIHQDQGFGPITITPGKRLQKV